MIYDIIKKIIERRFEMPGVTKHIYDHEMSDIITMWSNQLQAVQPLLPKEYDDTTVIALLKKYFPHEWKSVEIKYSYYKIKDEHIKRHRGKARYKMPKPEILLRRVAMYNKILSPEYKNNWSANYSIEKQESAKEILWNKRKGKIESITQKIDKALEKTQQVTPAFIDQLIGLYERKSTTQKDRVYILLELKKYYSPKIIHFFFKLNDTELNEQLRIEAFKHLQSFNYQPRLRRQKYMQVHTKNSKRKDFLRNVYPKQTYSIPQTPEELEYRIENSKEQKLKQYDYFISHSSKDRAAVQLLITAENQLGKNVFCDWINDVDYLKRHLVCQATLKVIEKRLEQSKSLIFVESENSNCSIWCKYELNYFAELGRPIYVVKKDSISKKIFDLEPISSDWFIDLNYKKLALIESSKIK